MGSREPQVPERCEGGRRGPVAQPKAGGPAPGLSVGSPSAPVCAAWPALEPGASRPLHCALRALAAAWPWQTDRWARAFVAVPRVASWYVGARGEDCRPHPLGSLHSSLLGSPGKGALGKVLALLACRALDTCFPVLNRRLSLGRQLRSPMLVLLPRRGLRHLVPVWHLLVE